MGQSTKLDVNKKARDGHDTNQLRGSPETNYTITLSQLVYNRGYFKPRSAVGFVFKFLVSLR